MKNTGNKTQKTGEGAKKKSRRWRRKPKNLLEEYARRQRKHAWLETHIWHAKRMRMIDTWGYRLADHPNDKGFRACYRAVKNHSFLQVIIQICSMQTLTLRMKRPHLINIILVHCIYYFERERGGGGGGATWVNFRWV